jgi:putative acetyltransferase
MQTKTVIRGALTSDLEALPDIWLRSVRASHTFLQEEDIQSLLPAVRDYLRTPCLELWILWADAPAGFMALSGAVVDALFLAPEHFRRGGGTMLLGHARSLKGPLSVDVNEQNQPALRFYLARGFAVVGRSPVDDAGRPFPLLHLREVRS